MKNLKNWLNKNNFSFEVKNNMVGEEMVFINIQDLGNENNKRVKTYLKRYKFNFEYRCNYTYIVAKKEDVKTCEVIDNSIAESEIKENKTNDLTQQANDLVESLPVKKGSKAIEYINYLKNNNIDSKDSKNKLVLAARVHLVRYGSFKTDAIAKAAEIEKVSSTKELELKYFNRLLDLLKEQKEVKEIKEERTLLKMNLQALATNKNKLRPIFNANIKGHEEYIKEQLKIFLSGDLNFTHKRINNKMITEYTKYFVYKDNTFMSVKPSNISYVGGYYEHVKKYNYKVDHANKIILFTDSEGII